MACSCERCHEYFVPIICETFSDKVRNYQLFKTILLFILVIYSLVIIILVIYIYIFGILIYEILLNKENTSPVNMSTACVNHL